MSRTTKNNFFFPFFFWIFFFFPFFGFFFLFFFGFFLIFKRRNFFTFHHMRVFLPSSHKDVLIFELFRTSAFLNFTMQRFFRIFTTRVLKYQILPHKGFKFHHTRVLKLYHTKVLKWYHKGF